MIGGAAPQLSDQVLDEIAAVLVDEAEMRATRKDRTPGETSGPQTVERMLDDDSS